MTRFYCDRCGDQVYFDVESQPQGFTMQLILIRKGEVISNSNKMLCPPCNLVMERAINDALRRP